MKKSSLEYPRATELTRYHLDLQQMLPQNAVTGVPETTYLSMVQLRGHVPLSSPHPFSPTGALWPDIPAYSPLPRFYARYALIIATSAVICQQEIKKINCCLAVNISTSLRGNHRVNNNLSSPLQLYMYHCTRLEEKYPPKWYIFRLQSGSFWIQI